MSENGTQPMQADGQNSPKRKPDGMTPEQRGRGPGGESGGGAYSDSSGKEGTDTPTSPEDS